MAMEPPSLTSGLCTVFGQSEVEVGARTASVKVASGQSCRLGSDHHLHPIFLGF